MDPKQTLLEELRRHALIVGEVTLTSGATAQYYVDAKRAILRPAGFHALAELVAGYARDWEATAVGGLTMGADAPACAALAGGADVKAFFVRKEAKAHGLQRRIEGPDLEPGERCLVVEDVVTTGGSALETAALLERAGAGVAGIAAVVGRTPPGAQPPEGLSTLVALQAPAWAPEACPACIQGVALSSPGSRRLDRPSA
jgi:orotate phosphoribosyltransferase